MCFFVQTNHTRKELLFLMFKEINLRNHSSLHKLFYSLCDLESTAHLMIYKVTGTYYKYIFDKKFDDAKKIRQELLSLGCTAGVKNWPI